MAENTEISWADDTFNPWEGCQKVSPACDGSYAEARNLRYAPKGAEEAPNWGPGAPRRRTSASNWAKPVKWNRQVQELTSAWMLGGMRGPMPTRFVFCASLADVFDNAVEGAWRHDLFELIRETPHLTWLLLTKRPGNIVSLYQRDAFSGDLETWPKNAAIGCTIVTQEEADRDIPKLLAAKAALNPAFAFVSMEPLLEEVNLSEWLFGRVEPCATCPKDVDCECGWQGRHTLDGEVGLDWIITGGETDQGEHKARPANPDWFRSLRDQCSAAGVPFHHKQNGEFCEFGERGMMACGSLNFLGRPDDVDTGKRAVFGDVIVQRIGKARAGRFLDGVTHDARPTVPL